MVSVTVVVCVIEPLVPVTVTTNVPRESPLDPWNVKVAVPVPPDVTVMLVGLKVSATPVTDVADNETVPANPFRLVTVIVTEPDPVRCMVRLEGDAEMLKSGGAGAVTVRA